MKKTFTKILALALVAIMACAMLVSCGGPNSDPDKAKAALKENDYVAEKVDSTIGLAFYAWAGDVEAVVTGLSDDGFITILYYEDADAAKDAWEKVEKYVNDEKKDEKDDSDWVFEKSGKMIYFGNKDAIKAAK